MVQQPEQNQQARADRTVRILACPVCHGALRFAADRVACQGCASVYPVVDGIPVLIPARARQQDGR